MSRTGLRILDTRFNYVSDVLALQKRWAASGMTPEKRAQALVDSANKALATYHVPKLTLTFSGLPRMADAFFDHRDWTIALDKGAFKGNSAPGNDAMAELAESVYHESRHAEQWFLAARLCTHGGVTPEALARQGLKASVAQASTQYPLEPGSPEDGLAERLVYSLMTAEGTDRIIESQEDLDILSDGSKASKTEKAKAQKRLEDAGYLRGKTDLHSVQRASARAYQYQLPEADAWDTGRLVSEVFWRRAGLVPLPPVPVHA